ncbi:MAG: hypothetical protein DWQ47_05810 [Acidobacteria bacterium]|nr:MAG: hypothetical protein DWQ32_09360 [Acidobacteriota bacterium]REK01895.1 MAG: hypothetical protein DWQ38_05795 [Acidobacteriota bacterium]REK14851.1 MAG: hypothetical protein DWQ43_15050 [Acidobacteriota bacterium]REK45566.1 MAG: hypothetical protein DWQ47_05810 [Acidobacteriota bacterium]
MTAESEPEARNPRIRSPENSWPRSGNTRSIRKNVEKARSGPVARSAFPFDDGSFFIKFADSR